MGSGGNAGPSIPLQPSAPQELMPSTSYPPPPQHALPPIPSSHPHHSTQPQANMCPNFTVHGASSSGMNQSQQTAFNALQLQQSQLVVALPPESGHANGHHGGRSQAYLPEPPPPYPGHPPSLPPRPLVSSSAPSRPNLPSAAAIAGPSHGYGEGRGHYNRRSSNSHAANMSASSNSGFGHKNSSAGGKNSKMR